VDLFVDGHAHDCRPGPDETLDDVLELVRRGNQSSHRAILGLACDGIDILGDDLNSYLTAPARKFERIDVHTGMPDVLISHALAEAARILDVAESERAQVVDMFIKGKTGDGIILLGTCLSRWFQINEAISKSLGLIGVIPGAFEVDLESLASALDPVSRKLGEIKSAVQSQDYVALADILEYEFNDVTNCWRKVIEAMLGQVGAAQ